MHNDEDMTEYSTAVRDTGSEAIKATVQSVLEIFGPLRAGQLAAWSHRTGSPWWRATVGECTSLGMVIPDNSYATTSGAGPCRQHDGLVPGIGRSLPIRLSCLAP